MCLRFMFLLITRLAVWLGLSRREETWKTAEILILRHQLAVLQRHQPRRPKLNWADRALLATLLSVIPKARRQGLRLLVTPDTIVRWRREHQPGGQNAGSVFRNPPGDSAGRLIEAAGLKGLRVGGAVVSDKHANFFQAEAGATARDVLDLVAEVQRRVAKASGVDLVPELHVVGDDEGVE